MRRESTKAPVLCPNQAEKSAELVFVLDNYLDSWYTAGRRKVPSKTPAPAGVFAFTRVFQARKYVVRNRFNKGDFKSTRISTYGEASRSSFIDCTYATTQVYGPRKAKPRRKVLARGKNVTRYQASCRPAEYLRSKPFTRMPLPQREPPPRKEDAATACPRYAGTKTSFTKASNDVGVVFFADRGSSPTTRPSLMPSHISRKDCVKFCEKPMLARIPAISSFGACMYARSGLPIPAPIIFATSE